MTWHLGLDLGRERDRTSLALVEPHRDRWALTWLRTWRPERPDCVDALDVVLELVRRERQETRPRLAIDARGLGRDATEAALEGAVSHECDVYPLLPSFSDRTHRQREDGYTWASKRLLVEGLLRALSSGVLVVARGLPEAAALEAELVGLRLVPTRRGTAKTWSHPDQRRGSHDDRVQACAYAYWLASTLAAQGQMDAIRPARRK